MSDPPRAVLRSSVPSVHPPSCAAKQPSTEPSHAARPLPPPPPACLRSPNSSPRFPLRLLAHLLSPLPVSASACSLSASSLPRRAGFSPLPPSSNRVRSSRRASSARIDTLRSTRASTPSLAIAIRSRAPRVARSFSISSSSSLPVPSRLLLSFRDHLPPSKNLDPPPFPSPWHSRPLGPPLESLARVAPPRRSTRPAVRPAASRPDRIQDRRLCERSPLELVPVHRSLEPCEGLQVDVERVHRLPAAAHEPGLLVGNGN